MHARLSVTIWLPSPLVGQTTDEGGGAVARPSSSQLVQRSQKGTGKIQTPEKSGPAGTMTGRQRA